MKFRYRIYIGMMILLSALNLGGCGRADEPGLSRKLHLTAGAASGPYFTRDQDNVPVLCWTEQRAADSLFCLRYARYDSGRDGFFDAITVPGSIGMNPSPESMGKVAFKADGTVVAIYGKRFPREKSPYAGAIYYSSSKDQGKTWSPSAFIHSDTARHYGRSFFDASRLPDGEIAVVWLDGRFGKEIKGSALFFAKTEKSGGFGVDVCLKKGTCECCRTNLIAETDGKLHIAYRGMEFPEGLFAAQVRDMAYINSPDGGETFSPPKGISEDLWKIDGCPHSGPSMGVDKEGVHATWYTAGGKSGIYYAMNSAGQTFSKRRLISEDGRHPQLAVLNNGKQALVFEKPAQVQADRHGAHGHAQAGRSQVILNVLKNGKIEKEIPLSEGKFAEHHAVLSSTSEGMLVAWISEQQGNSVLYYRYIANL